MTIDVTLYGSDNDILVDCAFANRLAKTAITGATVNVTVRDADGDEVTGVAWPLTLSEVGTLDIQHPDGTTVTAARYVGTIEAASNIAVDSLYEVEIDLSAGGVDAEWLIKRVAQRLGS